MIGIALGALSSSLTTLALEHMGGIRAVIVVSGLVLAVAVLGQIAAIEKRRVS